MIYLIVLAYGLLFAASYTVVSWVVSFVAVRGIRFWLPEASDKRVAFLASIPLPIFAITMAVMPWVPMFIGTHRGPEVTMMAITLASLPFVFLIGWPLMFFVVQKRILKRDRKTVDS